MGLVGALLDPADWRAYRARGAWLVLAWALAGAFLFGLPVLVKPVWNDVRTFFGGPTQEPMWIFVWGSWSMNAGLTLVGNLVYGVLYAGQFSAVETCKTNRDQVWPWLSPHAETRTTFWRHLKASILRVVLNQVLVVPALLLTYSMMSRFGRFGSAVGDFPEISTIAWQIAVSAVVEDVMFYS
jgi:hypothetical protein